MFHLAKNVRTSPRTLVPVLQRLLSSSVISDHKQIRTLECRNGEKVCNRVFAELSIYFSGSPPLQHGTCFSSHAGGVWS